MFRNGFSVSVSDVSTLQLLWNTFQTTYRDIGSTAITDGIFLVPRHFNAQCEGLFAMLFERMPEAWINLAWFFHIFFRWFSGNDHSQNWFWKLLDFFLDHLHVICWCKKSPKFATKIAIHEALRIHRNLSGGLAIWASGVAINYSLQKLPPLKLAAIAPENRACPKRGNETGIPTTSIFQVQNCC